MRAADAQYVQETGKAQVDCKRLLWKTYRNIGATEEFPDLWKQFRNDLSHAETGIMPTVVDSKDPNLGSNAINRPGQGTMLDVPNHTGHPAANTQGLDSNEINKPSTVPQLNIPKDTAHRENENACGDTCMCSKAAAIFKTTKNMRGHTIERHVRKSDATGNKTQ